MKNIIFLILLLLSLSINCSMAKNEKNSFEGKWSWEKNSDKATFTVDIKKEKDKYIGSFCAVAQSGNRIDCSDEDELSFEFKDLNKNIIETEFLSFYCMEKGKIKLELKDNKLYWTIIKEPNGVFYCPLKAVLIKNK